MKKIFIILLFILIFFFIAEIHRCQGTVRLDSKHFYKLNHQFIAPYNIWCRFNSYEKNTPFPDMKIHFPNHTVLQNNWIKIKNEALNIYNSGNASSIKNDMFFRGLADNKWKKFYIKWYGPIEEEAYKLCPLTCKLIEQLPEIKLAMFSILEPGSKIPSHAGPFKGCIRYHLGLNCPEESYIIVDGIKYHWKNGEDILFDDTFVHEVKNESKDNRIILFCDIKRKMNGPWSELFNNYIIKWMAPITTRSNNKQEKIIKI